MKYPQYLFVVPAGTALIYKVGDGPHRTVIVEKDTRLQFCGESSGTLWINNDRALAVRDILEEEKPWWKRLLRI